MLTTKKTRQLQAYQKFMAQDESQELLDLFEEKKRPIFLGSKDFVAWVKGTWEGGYLHNLAKISTIIKPVLFFFTTLL